MTLNEAVERVGVIWGRERLISVRTRPDGGAEVNLRPMSRPASDTRGRTFSYHVLDPNGHPICHDDCRKLEA